MLNILRPGKKINVSFILVSSLEGRIVNDDDSPLHQGLFFILYDHVFDYKPTFSSMSSHVKEFVWTGSFTKIKELNPNPIVNHTKYSSNFKPIKRLPMSPLHLLLVLENP